MKSFKDFYAAAQYTHRKTKVITEEHHPDTNFFNGLCDYIESTLNIDVTQPNHNINSIDLDDVIDTAHYYIDKHDVNYATEKNINYVLDSQSVYEFMSRLLACMM